MWIICLSPHEPQGPSPPPQQQWQHHHTNSTTNNAKATQIQPHLPAAGLEKLGSGLIQTHHVVGDLRQNRRSELFVGALSCS